MPLRGGGGVGRLMANAILNFHFDYLNPSLRAPLMKITNSVIPRPNGSFFIMKKWFPTYLIYIWYYSKIIRIFTHWFFMGIRVCARWGRIFPPGEFGSSKAFWIEIRNMALQFTFRKKSKQKIFHPDMDFVTSGTNDTCVNYFQIEKKLILTSDFVHLTRSASLLFSRKLSAGVI